MTRSHIEDPKMCKCTAPTHFRMLLHISVYMYERVKDREKESEITSDVFILAVHMMVQVGKREKEVVGPREQH